MLGGPGCGKGTNCARIVADFHYVHLSAGDLLREEKEKPASELATLINTCIVEGKIVPADVTVKLLRNAMDKNYSENNNKNKFLVDGFPRDLENLACWQKNMDDIANVQFLLFLDCSHEIMVERLLERGKTSGRSDDNMATIEKRLATYEQQTRPIIERFTADNKVRKVDAAQPPEKVYEDVKKHFI